MNEYDSQLEPLLSRAKRGDREALGNLLDLHRGYLKVFTRRLLDSWLTRKENDSDLVQMSMAEAIKGFPEFQGNTEAQFLAWLQKILRRNVDERYRHHRRQKRDAGREQTDGGNIEIPDGSTLSPSRRLLRDENAVLLAAAMECLSEAEYEAVRLKHLEELSLSDVADRMGRSYDIVAKLSCTAIKKLKQRLRTIAKDHFDS